MTHRAPLPLTAPRILDHVLPRMQTLPAGTSQRVRKYLDESFMFAWSSHLVVHRQVPKHGASETSVEDVLGFQASGSWRFLRDEDALMAVVEGASMIMHRERNPPLLLSRIVGIVCSFRIIGVKLRAWKWQIFVVYVASVTARSLLCANNQRKKKELWIEHKAGAFSRS